MNKIKEIPQNIKALILLSFQSCSQGNNISSFVLKNGSGALSSEIFGCNMHT